MTEDPSYININDPDFVNRHAEEAAMIEADIDKMLALVDLIFGFEPDRLPPS